MNVVCATNDQYARHLGVMLTSLLENTKSRDPIKIFIIDGDISATNKRMLNKAVGKFKTNITFLTPDKKLLKALPTETTIDYITKETYFRIFLPKMLDKKIKKILYLDCDLIVKKDITELWNTNIKKYVLAAVDESCLLGLKKKSRLSYELGMPEESLYFNGGVLLLNIKKCRETRVTERILAFLKEHSKLKYMDQDAMNAVLRNNWLQVDCKWNYTSCHWYAFPHVKPAIIHFTGRRKPWNSNTRFKQEYDKYFELFMRNTREAT